MAEFECGYCTGCGFPLRRPFWRKLFRVNHRPYCWRKVTMMLGIDATDEVKRLCLNEMQKHWRIRSFFVGRKEHMYYQPGYDIPEPAGPLRVTEIEQDGNEVLTHLSDGRCAVNQLPKEEQWR